MSLHLAAVTALAVPGRMILAVVALVAVVVLLGGWIWTRRPPAPGASIDDDDRPLPPLIFPMRPAAPEGRAATFEEAAPSALEELVEPGESSAEDVAEQDTTESPIAEAPQNGSGSVHGPSAPQAADEAKPSPDPRRVRRKGVRFKLLVEETEEASPAGAAGGSAGGTSDTTQERTEPEDPVIRSHPLTDGTLQLLPGRLEVVGKANQQEIRFVRPNTGDAVVTFGRQQSDSIHHVQLDAPTVSRLHARMTFLEGSWHVVNLSRTNPLVLNGVRLTGERQPAGALLEDGDVLEMGEIVFRFRIP